jgi:hypothetical protein
MSIRCALFHRRCFSLLLLLLLLAAGKAFAVSYVVPTDRFEIERASAVIVGRVLSSHVEKSPRFGIETVTDVALEEAIKGDFGSVLQVREPGGALGDEALVIPGVPTFIDGDRVMLLLYARVDGHYLVSDLALGSFTFAKDIAGQELLIRDESELVGRDVDGSEHRERRRSAERFLDYVRGIVRGEPVDANYVVTTVPLVATQKTTQPRIDAMHPIGNALFTATSYTFSANGAPNGPGTRWSVFPGAVNWNQGNMQPGAPGGGTPAINNAFAAWNGGGTDYVLASFNANTKGIFDNPADFINNIVFEKDLTSAGIQPHANCSGVLGVGGVHKVSGTNMFHGETFDTIVEGDVSMNQGLSTCPAFVSSGDFNTSVAHEIGHTLGFRHSDQNRLNGACAGDPSLDCSANAAIMNHIINNSFGINGHLQAWDVAAVGALYGAGPACTPPSITQQPGGSTISSGGTAMILVAAAGTPTLTYQWYIGTPPSTAQPVAGGTTASITVSPIATTTYWVRVTGQCAPVADSVAATVTVQPSMCAAPSISLQPQDQSVVSGNSANLFMGYVGTSGTVQWYRGSPPDTSTPVGTGQALQTQPLTTTATFWARVTNNCGSADTRGAVVTVMQTCTAPAITSVTATPAAITAGQMTTLSVVATGASLSYQWFKGQSGNTSTPITAATTPSITDSPAATTSYWVRVSSGCGATAAISSTISVTVGTPRRRSVAH